jgi:hypothetical protein
MVVRRLRAQSLLAGTLRAGLPARRQGAIVTSHKQPLGYTPGPWGFKRASSTSKNILDIEGGGKLLAFTAATCDESAANARLITAAPDLLEASERMVAATEADQHFIGVEHDALKAAIAKARGQ